MILQISILEEIALLKKLRGVAKKDDKFILEAMYNAMIDSYERIISEDRFDVVINDNGDTVIKRFKRND